MAKHQQALLSWNRVGPAALYPFPLYGKAAPQSARPPWSAQRGPSPTLHCASPRNALGGSSTEFRPPASRQHTAHKGAGTPPLHRVSAACLPSQRSCAVSCVAFTAVNRVGLLEYSTTRPFTRTSAQQIRQQGNQTAQTRMDPRSECVSTFPPVNLIFRMVSGSTNAFTACHTARNTNGALMMYMCHSVSVY